MWQYRLGDGDKMDVEITQAVTTVKDGIRFDFVASAFNDSSIEGVIFWIDLPAAIIAKGTFETHGVIAAMGLLPSELTENKILSSGTMESIQLINPDKSIRLDAKFDTPMNATIQDNRRWSNHFSVLIQGHHDFLLKGQTAKFSVVISATGEPDLSPAVFVVDSTKPRYMIQGLGGNYCFQLEAPEKAISMKELRPQFARTEISLNDWMPKKGEAPAPTAGKVPLEFELMRELSQRKIPYIASVWKAPMWMTRTVENPPAHAETVIASEHFPAAIEAIGAYLSHVKEHFQSEPDYVSFNEPDYGAQIKFTPDEHRDAIKLLGAELKKRGLKARCLLGDVSNPRTPMSYLQPAISDADAMRFVGALSFHSWGGGTPAHYAAWSDLAASLKLPLFVAEAGVDPGAWKGKTYRSFDYAVREMAHYQDIFEFARPQAVLYWEYTGDYALMEVDPKKPSERLETERFALQKHWLRFIPAGSDALETSGGNAAVHLTAFRHKTTEREHISLQVSNTQWPRKARIAGIPAHVKTLHVIQTTRGVHFKKQVDMTPVNGVVEIELPGQSLTALTTME